DNAKTQDETKGPEKAKPIPRTNKKKNENTPAPLLDQPRGLEQPPPQQAPELRRAPHSPDGSREPNQQQSQESSALEKKKESHPEAATLSGETESGMPAGNPGPGGKKPSQIPHDNSSSPGRNPNNAAKPTPPRSQQPAAPRPKPRDKSASPRRDRSPTSS